MELKCCPTCKALVFADMDVCYECMYRFGSDPEREAAAAADCVSDARFDGREGAGVQGDAARSARAVSLGGWDVRLEVPSALPTGTTLHITIEPASRETGSGDGLPGERAV
ncbi:hypothetical protein VJ918_07560 [Adlercreutzia sp. R21]|uniref:hypothetical protein n=1 Tax=Adlercreutzia wanghongyangiae TaxID=3111451 RepID=UPI002DBD4DC0|nr:hypothetical protein [Adlercreutzia sp. R21]MEC4184662.1 hypothetical protein [Adlercreutzia sp. R21]